MLFVDDRRTAWYDRYTDLTVHIHRTVWLGAVGCLKLSPMDIWKHKEKTKQSKYDWLRLYEG
jgi:hypothetical protein